MKMSNYELGMLAIIRDEVDKYLKSSNFKKNPEKSNIIPTLIKILPKIAIGKTFTIIVNKSSRNPFIMSIYPDLSELDVKSKKLSDILNDPKSNNEEYVREWCEIKNWVIEIDIRILLQDSPICVRNGSEFVAILCHEIGHVMVGDPLALIYNYKKKRAIYDRFDKIVTSRSKFVRRMMLPMFVNTLSFRIIKCKGNSLDKEIAADAYVPNEYRGYLLSYINDCILTTPNTSDLIVHDSDYERDQETAVSFSKESIEMMKDRRDVLRHQLNAQYNGCEGSMYKKSLMQLLGKTLGNYNVETDKMDVLKEAAFQKQYVSELCEFTNITEAILENTKVSDRDLSILEVQCSDIKTTEDKIYLIHTIYDFIEAITKENSAKLKKSKDPNIKEFIKNDSRLTRLNACRELVMRTNTTDVGDRYGLFVKYPKGYEG